MCSPSLLSAPHPYSALRFTSSFFLLHKTANLLARRHRQMLMDSFVKSLPLIYSPLPLPLLLLYEEKTVAKVKISICLSITAVSHPVKHTKPKTLLPPGVCFNMTVTQSAHKLVFGGGVSHCCNYVIQEDMGEKKKKSIIIEHAFIYWISFHYDMLVMK